MPSGTSLSLGRSPQGANLAPELFRDIDVPAVSRDPLIHQMVSVELLGFWMLELCALRVVWLVPSG